jgi:stage V sporulation protein D (sporulation-specific penicillin-binding protein)
LGRKERGVTWRLWAVVAALGLGTLIISGRLAQLQIVDHDRYAREARLIHMSEDTLLDRRGALLDRNGYPLAASEDAFDVLVEHRAWENPNKAIEAAQELSAVTAVPPEQMVQEVSASEIFETSVARNLSFEQATAARDLGLRGVRLVKSSHRVYPEGNLAAQLLGFVGRDNVGLTGLESDLDSVLGGSKGLLRYERDGLGNQFALGDTQTTAAVPGANVVLTIDRYIQRLAELELKRTIDETKAGGGTIVVVQPKTGEVLAMASQPTFDVTKLDLTDDSKIALYRNRAVTDMYEPGSVFKLITTAAGLDSGMVGPNTWWYDHGAITVSDWTIRNWDLSANGSMTVQQMLSRSLNTGAAWVAQQVGADRFYKYVDSFGFGKPTDVGLTGDSPGRVRTPTSDPDNWRPVDMATNSFGQGISVTPLQMVMAVAAIANDGMLMKPRLVKEVAYPGGTQPVPPEQAGQAISVESAQILQSMMGVVADGYADRYLDVKGYNVGGKTGTADLATPDSGYKKDAYISSFVGIAPLEDPVLAVLVKIDEPKGVPWGTVVAAPAFSRLVQQALAYLEVPPQDEALVTAP